MRPIKNAFKSSDIPKTSSALNADLAWGVVQGMVPGDPLDPNPLFQEDFTDLLDDDYNRALREAPVVRREVYQNHEPITTMAFRVYGTTTAWRAILTYNGFYHECEIPNGTEIRLPDLSFVATKIKQRNTPTGRVVFF